MLAVSEFWGGGDTWRAVVAVIVFVVLSLIALYQARTFVRKL